MTTLLSLVFIDLPVTDGSTATVRADQVVSVSDAAPRPADRGLPSRGVEQRSRVIATGSVEISVALSRVEVLTLLRATLNQARDAGALETIVRTGR